MPVKDEMIGFVKIIPVTRSRRRRRDEDEVKTRERMIIAIAAKKTIMFHTYLRTWSFWWSVLRIGGYDTLPVPRF